jgi:hypothetical protein
LAVEGAYSVDPTRRRSTGTGVTYGELTGERSRVYTFVSIWLVVWAILHIFFVEAVFSNAILWLEYYAVNYRLGFVRRGLAGELIRIFPDDQFFTGAYAILGLSILAWLVGLAVLIWLILSTGARSERKIMLALVVPVLPFAFTYAIYNPHPELFGMTALLAFGMSLTRARTPRARLVLSALYGIAMAVLALVHEAIPLEFALGAVLAIIILSKDATHAARRICAVFAVAPGIVSILLVAVLGRRDIAAQLCSQVPHGMVDNPWAIATTPQKALDYILGRVESQADYHDWVCQYVTPSLDVNWTSAVKLVGNVGFSRLFGAFVLGVFFFVGTTWLIRYFSAVPVRTFLRELRGNLLLPVLASALLVPLFMTAVDWTRWWVMITLDVAVAYLLYAIERPEIEQPPSRKNVLVFVWVVMVLAVLPTGSANNVG